MWDEQQESVTSLTEKTTRVRTMNFSTYAVFQRPVPVPPPPAVVQGQNRLEIWQLAIIGLVALLVGIAMAIYLAQKAAADKMALKKEMAHRDKQFLEPATLPASERSNCSIIAEMTTGNAVQDVDDLLRPVDSPPHVPQRAYQSPAAPALFVDNHLESGSPVFYEASYLEDAGAREETVPALVPSQSKTRVPSIPYYFEDAGARDHTVPALAPSQPARTRTPGSARYA